MERVAVVGAGIAGALLAWRLRDRSTVDIYPGGSGPPRDATGASGGLVRAFEHDPHQRRLAAESLRELRDSAVLRAWAGYREVGSVYVLPAATAGVTAVVGAEVVGAEVVGAEELAARYGFRGLPEATVGVVEPHAGYLSPARLRQAVLADLAGSVGVYPEPVVAVAAPALVRLAGGATRAYDAVVLAAGAWTPALLAASGLPAGRLRTKHIQYGLYTVDLPRLGAFVDDTSGLYGRPAGVGLVLLGVPCDRWDVEPGAVAPVGALAAAALAAARERLPVANAALVRAVAAADCYADPPGLVLRRVLSGAGLFTFTGGSGGAAKTALAASRVAAHAMMSDVAVGAE